MQSSISSNNNDNFLLKIYYNEKTKRCSLPKDFEALQETVMRSFNSESLLEGFDVYYMDDEKDLILIENQFDYENACLFMRQNNHTTLKISVKTDEKFDANLAVKLLESGVFQSSKLSLNQSSNFMMSKSQVTQTRNEDNVNDMELNLINVDFSCERCGRKFTQKMSHSKHVKVCSKVFGTKRQPFDSRKQRLINAQFFREEKIKIDDLNEKICEQVEKLKEAMCKWKKSCRKLQSSLKNGNQRPFKDLFIECDSKQCGNCKRCFNSASYNKHTKNCYKLIMKRKPFESKKQRIINLEQAVLLRKQEMMNKNCKKFEEEEKEEKKKQKPRWQKLSERFRTIMRISRLLYAK